MKFLNVKFGRSLRTVDWRSLLIVAGWGLLYPVLWMYARLFPRIPDRVLFWTNEGFRVAPSRVRCYGFCREMRRMGVDAHVLSFWDDLAHYDGLPPFDIPLWKRAWLIYRAMIAGIRSRAGIIVAQRPFYEFMPLLSLRIMYPFSLKLWIDVDDWIFDYSLGGVDAAINFRDTLPFHVFSSQGAVVASVHLEEEMKKYFERVEIVPTFPDTTVFCPNGDRMTDDPNRQVVYSWIGTLFMSENAGDVLFLMETLNSLEDPRVVLEVVGDGAFLKDVKESARTIAPGLDVRFLGWHEPDKIPHYIAGIDVGLYCLRTHTDFTQSKSPTKLFEYMACGRPTVSTNYGEAARFIDHGVTGFLANGADDFRAHCKTLLDDPALRATMGRNARRKIEEQFNMATGVAKLRRIILNS